MQVVFQHLSQCSPSWAHLLSGGLSCIASLKSCKRLKVEEQKPTAVIDKAPTPYQSINSVLTMPSAPPCRAELGPRKAIDSFGFGKWSHQARAQWIEDARIMAALGPCSKTLPSVRSGVRCYVAFAGIPCVSRVRFRSMLAIRRAHCSNLRRHVEIVLSAAIALTSGLVSMFSLSPNLHQLRWLRAHILPCVGRRCAGASHCDATLSSIVLVYWQVFRHPLVQRAGFSVRALRCLLYYTVEGVSSTQWRKLLSSDLHTWPPMVVFN